MVRRFFILCVFALALVPVALILLHRVKTRVLYAGDQVESRACRECGGNGKNLDVEGMPPGMGDRCPACGGDGSVDVILPGWARPTRVRGAVANARRLQPFATFDDLRAGSEGKGPFAKPGETLSGVKVTFTRLDGAVVETECNPHGFFSTRLPPGTYKVTASAAGYEPLAGEVEVPALTTEIWLEEARIIRETESAAEAQSLYGFELLIALEPGGAGKSRLVFCYGTH